LAVRESFRPEAAELLKKANASVLLSIAVAGETARCGNSEDVESLRTSETRDKAATAPSVAHQSGCPGSRSTPMASPRRAICSRPVKKSIDAGFCPVKDAVRAPDPFRRPKSYGVADRIGSIEKGKIGNW